MNLFVLIHNIKKKCYLCSYVIFKKIGTTNQHIKKEIGTNPQSQKGNFLKVTVIL